MSINTAVLKQIQDRIATVRNTVEPELETVAKLALKAEGLDDLADYLRIQNWFEVILSSASAADNVVKLRLETEDAGP